MFVALWSWEESYFNGLSGIFFILFFVNTHSTQSSSGGKTNPFKHIPKTTSVTNKVETADEIKSAVALENSKIK